MKEGEVFRISQNEVLNAYKTVKANKGAGGVDGIVIEIFNKDWKNRLLGIPTIEDRVAQMVLRNRFEPLLEPLFYNDSYEYRPNKSALDAIATVRNRCFKMKWVIQFDIVGLFDNINHEMLMKMVELHCQEKWILM